MKLESRKVLTAKKIGLCLFAVLFFLITLPETERCFYSCRSNRRRHNLVPKRIAPIKRQITPSLQPLKTTTRVTSIIEIAKIVTTTTTRKSKKLTNTLDISNPMELKVFPVTPRDSLRVGFRILKPPIVRAEAIPLSKHFLCLYLMGRLGNAMFQYASAYGIARSKGMDLIITGNGDIAKVFHLNSDVTIMEDSFMCDDVKTIYEVRSCAFDKETMDFSKDENIFLWGYLQSFKYFEKVSDDIRRQFTFRDPIENKAKTIIRDIYQQHLQKQGREGQNWTFVGVHVRRGDMVNHPYGYMVAPKGYFLRAQNMFRGFKKHVLFIVCSDDINWCKTNIRSSDTYFVEGNSPVVDMAILSSCNHTISSVGTFSWWSAWLSKGLVAYYGPPARPRSKLRTQYSQYYSDFFPLNWIRVF